MTPTTISIETEIAEAQENVVARARAVEDAKAALERATSRAYTPASVLKRAKEALDLAIEDHAAAMEGLHAAVAHRENEQAAARRADLAKKTAARVRVTTAKLDAALAVLADAAIESAEIAAEIATFRVASHVPGNYADEWTRENVDASRVYWLAGEGRILVENLRAGRPFARRRR